MKIGVKTFDNRNFLRPFEDKVDFFEIMAIEKNNYDFLKEFKLPIVIHAQHRCFDVNNADKTKKEKNLNSINHAIKIADQTNSKKIILHPGDIEDKNCSEQQAIDFVKNLNDKRIIIENIPADPKMKRLCTTPEETKQFLIKTNKDFCFDINHAIESARVLKKDYLEFIKEFVKLKPEHYHFGGQLINSNLPAKERDHKPLEEADFDLKQVLKLIPRDAEITLETTTDLDKTLNDVKIMKEWIKELNL